MDLKKLKHKPGKKHEAILESLEGLRSIDEHGGTIKLLQDDITLKNSLKPYSDVSKVKDNAGPMSMVHFKIEGEKSSNSSQKGTQKMDKREFSFVNNTPGQLSGIDKKKNHSIGGLIGHEMDSV